jgi:hypothetical protein
MDREILLRHLAQAERHMVEGQTQVERVREVLARLKRDGHDTRRARELLRSFEETQAQIVTKRDWLGKEMTGTDT